MSVYAQSAYASNPLPQYGTGVPAHAVPGLHLMIQLRTRAFPTVRRLARIHVLPERFLEFCPACGGHVSESVEHLLVECPRWECHRRVLAVSAPEFKQMVGRASSCPGDTVALILGGVPPPLHGKPEFSGHGNDFLQLWRRALPHIALFVTHLSLSRNVFLREIGLAPPRITRTGRRPNG